MSFSYWFAAIFFFLQWPAVSLWSAEFPWLDSANTQVLTIRDPYVDFAARIAAIDRARFSIHSLTYLQGADSQIGLPLIQAFRRAQNRGLHGRYIVERMGSFLEDPLNKATALLSDSKLARPGEVISFGPLRKILAGLNITDMVHEKILILDAGTPDEVIWIGGRNNSSQTTQDLDLAVVLRRLEPGKPYVGDQIRAAFEDTWEAVNKVQPKRKPKSVTSAAKLPELNVVLDSERKQQAFQQLNDLLKLPVQASSAPVEFESRPKKMRVVTNGFLDMVMTRIFGRGFKARSQMPNDIIRVASETVAHSKHIFFSTMAVFMPPDLKVALKTALQNGAEVTIVTNSRYTHQTYMPKGLPYDLGLSDLVELMQVGGGKLTVYALDESLLNKAKAEGSEQYQRVSYLHRKLLIADDHVFLGSENFNIAGQARNNEIVLQAQDSEFPKRMHALIQEDLQVFQRLICESVLTDFKRYGWIRRGLNRIFLPLY